MSDDKKVPNTFWLRKKEAKKGDVWNTVANDRIYKQHPHGIGEDDRHAPAKIINPVLENIKESPEENEETLNRLAKQIEELKEKSKNEPPPPPPQAPPKQTIDDDWYD